MNNLPCHILLTGHRGSGKSILGNRTAQQLGIPFADLDKEIERREGRSAAELVSENEPLFRERELEVLAEIVRKASPHVIAGGGGLRIMEAIERGLLDRSFIVCIEREGWEDTARTARHRLHPEQSFEEEVRWMRSSREPLYFATADATLHIEHGCSEEDAASCVTALVMRLGRVHDGQLLRDTWMVPQRTEDIPRARRIASLFPIAGMEIRSDLDTCDTVPHSRYLASLRTDDRAFFQRHAGAAAFDCDLEYIDNIFLDRLNPRPLLLSTHPLQPNRGILEIYRSAIHQLAGKYPEWVDWVRIKYAPTVHTWDDLAETLVLYRKLRAYAETITGSVSAAACLPQGERWRWVRVMLLRENGANYVALPGESDETLPPVLEYLLPSVSGGGTRRFGIIGNPVDHSIGDLWHTEQPVLPGTEKIGYYKIPVLPDDVHDALTVLHGLGFEGLSVTAPLKRAVAQSALVENPSELTAGNTLTRTASGWRLDDTDEAGMLASLDVLSQYGIHSGRAAVFGRGGVSAAVIRALERRGFSVTEISARAGWNDIHETAFDLIVNASGMEHNAMDGAPETRGWLDLHYRNTNPPAGVEVYLSGIVFFRAQAQAQRMIWGLA